MFRFTRHFLALALGLVLVLGSPAAQAFSLRGPAAPWQTEQLGYGPIPIIFGPMNINEEYRWNVPTIYYAYTPDFLTYFGDRGVQEIEKAIQILNALPPADSINLDDYPQRALRINSRAQALQLFDLKSFALSAVLNQVGLTDPRQFVFALRSRFIVGGAPTNYFVIKRNFDPVTWDYSSFINGQLWTYSSIFEVENPAQSIVAVEPVDPLALGGLLNAPVTATSPFGGFWTGLTRDDVGGLKYIYRSLNQNVETVTNALGAGFGVVTSGASSGSPWAVPAPVQTGTGTAIPGASTNFVDAAVRPGVGKLTFQRVFYDSQLGFFLSNTVAWTDRFVTNGSTIQQNLVRAQVIPDILFDGRDLFDATDSDTGAPALLSEVQGAATPVWQNNDALNGQTGNGANGQSLGPGIIPPSSGTLPTVNFIFNTVGPVIVNIFPLPSGFLSEINNAGTLFLWGSFDGTTNEPVIYPKKASIEELERIVLGGGGGGGGGGGTGLSPWTVPLPLPTTTATGGAGGTTTP